MAVVTQEGFVVRAKPETAIADTSDMKIRYAVYAALAGFGCLIGPPALLLAADAMGFALFLTWGIVISGMICSVGVMAWKR